MAPSAYAVAVLTTPSTTTGTQNEAVWLATTVS